MKVTMMPIIIRTLGIILKEIEKGPRHSKSSALIVRRVLESRGKLLSLKLTKTTSYS